MRHSEKIATTVACVAATIDRQTAGTILGLQKQDVSQVVFRNKASVSTGRLFDAAVNVDWLPMESSRRTEASTRLQSWLGERSGVILHALGIEETSIALSLRSRLNAPRLLK